MHSVADLTTFSRPTTGDVPPKLVGASTTVVGDKMYIFGGRLVAERRMVSDMYAFDMETYNWEKIAPTNAEKDTPRPRYFHSCDTWSNYLVVFGGMGVASPLSPSFLDPSSPGGAASPSSLNTTQSQSSSPNLQQPQQPPTEGGENLCVLSDVRFFDLTNRRWLSEDEAPAVRSSSGTSSPNPNAPPITQPFIPRGRYAHLSSITYHTVPSSTTTPTSSTHSPGLQRAFLYIIGGQDLHNLWLDDICIFALHECKWVTRKEYPRHSGTYRSVAVTSPLRVRYPSTENEQSQPQYAPGTRFGGSKIGAQGTVQGINGEYTHPNSFNHLSYSAEPTEDYPCEIYLYSNYNFTDVKRELEVFTPLPPSPTPTSATPHPAPPTIDFQMSDRSTKMTGQTLPPGLRFPTGAICGSHLIFAGTYLANSYQSFSIWALDLQKMTWTRIEPGTALSKGSWFKGCLWTPTKEPGQSRFVIFGNKQGNLVEDYNRRLLSWEDVVYLDLASFGIYQPPTLRIGVREQELGLSALEEGVGADFEVVCDDGRRIACSRRVLEGRWEWFRTQRELLVEKTKKALETIPPSPADVPLPPPPAGVNDPEPRLDPRLTPRTLLLSEPYPVTLALLQYFYTLSLITPLQHAPAVLSQLLLLASNYNINHLKELVQHAMHGVLSSSSSVGVYEVATLCGCQSLQIRALKAVMASSKKSAAQRAPAPGGPPSGPDGGPNGPGNNGNGGGNGGGHGHHAARPRGMSDLRGHPGSGVNGSSGGVLGGIVEGNQSNGYQHQANYSDVGQLFDSSFSLSSSALYNRRHQHQKSTISIDTLYQAIQTVSDEMINDSDDSSGDTSDAPNTSQDESDERDDMFGSALYTNFSRPTSRMREGVFAQSYGHRLNGNGSVTPPASDQRVLHPPRHASLDTFKPSQKAIPEIWERSSVNHPDIDESDETHAYAYEPDRSSWSHVPYEDSDRAATPSLKSSTSVGSLSSLYKSHQRPGHSPSSPESPSISTPMDAYFPNVGIRPSLSSIKERASYDSILKRDDEQKKRPAPLNPSWVTASQSSNSPRASFSSQQDYVSSPPNSAYRVGTATSTTGSSSSGPHTPLSSISITSSMNAARQSNPWRISPPPITSAFGLKRSSFQTVASQNTVKMDRNMMKAQKKAEEERAKQQAALLSPQERKAIKAEEKRRKKDEEKMRIEQLAVELKARSRAAKDGSQSINSAGSNEKKATEWVENSGGMYGGIIGWSSL